MEGEEENVPASSSSASHAEAFFALRRRADPVAQLFHVLQRAADHYYPENRASTTIQAGFRGMRVRKRWRLIKASVRYIQRCGRGLLGRRRMCTAALVHDASIRRVFAFVCFFTHVHCLVVPRAVRNYAVSALILFNF